MAVGLRQPEGDVGTEVSCSKSQRMCRLFVRMGVHEPGNESWGVGRRELLDGKFRKEKGGDAWTE